jgi:hypothetical protein
VLSFVTAPTFEHPSDVGGNNVYDVVVQASDRHGGIDTQAIAVSVQNVGDAITHGPASDDVSDKPIAGSPVVDTPDDTHAITHVPASDGVTDKPIAGSPVVDTPDDTHADIPDDPRVTAIERLLSGIKHLSDSGADSLKELYTQAASGIPDSAANTLKELYTQATSGSPFSADQNFGATTERGSPFRTDDGAHAVDKSSSSASTQTQTFSPPSGGTELHQTISSDLKAMLFEAGKDAFNFKNFDHLDSGGTHAEGASSLPVTEHHSPLASGFFF